MFFHEERFAFSVLVSILILFTITSGQTTTRPNSTQPKPNGTTPGGTTTKPGTDTTTTKPNISCSINETQATSGKDCATCLRPDVSCPEVTENRCYCKDGYVRNTAGICILLSDCGQAGKCWPNASEVSSSSNCFTCDNYLTATCPFTNKLGCYCNDGYVFDIDNRRCVLSNDCPKYPYGQCRANQTFASRGNDCDTCGNYGVAQECYISTEAKCYCNVGYVRDTRTKRCVFAQDCPQNIADLCSVNETLLDNGVDCATCRNPDAICDRQERRKCYCLNGYVRTANGDCVDLKDCPRINLPERGSCRDPWSFGCNPICIPRCKGRGVIPKIICPLVCQACFCPAGQVRNDNGVCVPFEKCREYPYDFPNMRYRFK